MQRGLGAQVTTGDLAHAFGQQQQGLGQLGAQQHRQQHRTEHRQEEGQGEGAYVHALEAAAGQRTLLVFAVGFLHRHGVADQVGRQVLAQLQIAHAARQLQAGRVDHGQGTHAGLGHSRARCHDVIEAINLRGHALAARQAHLRAAGTLGLRDQQGATAGAGQQLTRGAP